MRWRRQIIGVGEKIGGNFAAAKVPLQLTVWGKIFLRGRACGFRREGVKLSEAGGRVQGYRRTQERAAVRPRLDGLRASLAIFSALFSLNFRSLCARVDRGRETRPRAPVWYRARTPSAFFARRRKWRRSRFARLLSLPLCRRGDSLSRSRGSCRHDSPPRPVAQGLRANFSTACSKVIFYYKRENRVSEFPCCSGFGSRDRA